MSSEPLYLDVECVPIDDAMTYYDEAAEADIEAPKHYGAEAAARYIEREKAHRRVQHLKKAALDPDLCRIVILGAWWPGEPHPTIWTCETEQDEHDVLVEFWELYQFGQVVCGFNIRPYDLAVIYRRSLYLQVKTKNIDRDRYRSTCVLDLFEVLNEGRKDKMRSMNWYCKRMGLYVPQDDVDGADIAALVAAGEWDKARHHNYADLMKVRALAKRVVPALRDVA